MSQHNEYRGKVLIVAPFWETKNHVGNYRIERFIKWLQEKNYSVILLKAAFKNDLKEKEWGLEISVIDRVGKISDFFVRTTPKVKTKIFSYIWYALVLFFSPVDPYFFWTRNVKNNKLLSRYMNNIDLILSSSPPNSGLIAAYKLSKKYSIPLMVDLRDGWLDEPLISGLRKPGIRKSFEGRLEKKILSHAVKIFVTSIIWKNMLSDRLPAVRDKISLLTNAYPEFEFTSSTFYNENHNLDVKLLYAGRFTGSSYLRNPEILFNPLYNELLSKHYATELLLLSNLKRKDNKHMDYWISRFKRIGCTLSSMPQVNREKMLEMITNSDGLLLLSTSRAPIPSKAFEYIKSSKPILAVTLKDSAVWQMCNNIPQMFLFDYTEQKPDYTQVEKFLSACQTGEYEYNIPEEYSEEYLSKIFLNTIDKIY